MSELESESSRSRGRAGAAGAAAGAGAGARDQVFFFLLSGAMGASAGDQALLGVWEVCGLDLLALWEMWGLCEGVGAAVWRVSGGE